MAPAWAADDEASSSGPALPPDVFERTAHPTSLAVVDFEPSEPSSSAGLLGVVCDVLAPIADVVGFLVAFVVGYVGHFVLTYRRRRDRRVHKKSVKKAKKMASRIARAAKERQEAMNGRRNWATLLAYTTVAVSLRRGAFDPIVVPPLVLLPGPASSSSIPEPSPPRLGSSEPSIDASAAAPEEPQDNEPSPPDLESSDPSPDAATSAMPEEPQDDGIDFGTLPDLVSAPDNTSIGDPTLAHEAYALAYGCYLDA